MLIGTSQVMVALFMNGSGVCMTLIFLRNASRTVTMAVPVEDDNANLINGAVVTAIPVNYNPVSGGTLPEYMSDITEFVGVFSIEMYDSGTFNCEIIDGASGKRSIVRSFDVISDSTNLHTITIRDPGFIKVLLSDTLDYTNGYLYLNGTRLSKNLSDARLLGFGTYEITFDSVFASSVPPLYYNTTGNPGNEILLKDSITAISGDTTIIDLSTGSGNCLNFGGSGSGHHVEIAHSSALSPTSQITFECWAYCQDWTEVQDVADYLLDKLEGQGTNGGYSLRKNALNGQIEGTVIHSSNTVQSVGIPLSQISSGWHHIAFTFDGLTSRVYLDGDEIDSQNASGPGTMLYSEQLSLRIGGNGDYDNTFEGEEFKGKIDEVRIWSIARTSAQIKGNIYTLCTGSETGLVGYWRFDEASGTTLKDYSVNANDGVLKNMDNSAWQKSNILF